MQSFNPTPRQIALNRLKKQFNDLNLQFTKKITFEYYLNLRGINLKSYLDNFEKSFSRKQYYIGKSKYRNNKNK